MTRQTQTPNSGKPRGAQPFTSKTASFYQKSSAQPTVPAGAPGTAAGPAPGTAVPNANRASNSGQFTPNLGSTSPLSAQSATLTGRFTPRRATSSRSFKIALISLLVSLIGLSFIFAMQVEMKGAGAYLYLMVTVSAFVYIVATMVYVVTSARRPK